jgi:rfaE bifunctional protein kinase chain/domain
MTNPLDQKGKSEDKPDVKQEQTVAPAKDKEELSLGNILPVGSDPKLDVLHAAAHDAGQQGTTSLEHFSGAEIYPNALPTPDSRTLNPDVGRFLSKNFTRDLSNAISRDALKEQDSRAQEFKFSDQAKADIKSGPPLGFPIGGRPFLTPRKSEFKPLSDEKPATNLTPQVDKFLTETAPRDEHKLSQGERNELSQTRRQLADATTPDEIVSNALHLARLYQHLKYIEEAKNALQLALGIDPENMQGKQVFKELERVHPMDVQAGGLTSASKSLSKAALRKRIINFSQGRVIVVGDLLIDELLEGKPERISREAPVLILEHVDTVLIPGGAANTAHNISALGGTCHAVGLCGHDEYAAKMAKLLETCGISHSLAADASRPTTVKTRILSKSHSLMQQLLRLDRISHEPISPSIEADLIAKIKLASPGFKAIVLSDYKAGVITDGIIAACREIAKDQKLMLIVDAQERFERFKDVTLMTPNQPDTEKYVGYPLNNTDSLKKAGSDILMQTNASALLVTRGPHGMVLFQKNQEPIELPVFNKSDVFDVTGAGDTVVGTMALALVTGASFTEAMALGNLAAGIVVRKSGTAVTNQRELLENLERLNLSD